MNADHAHPVNDGLESDLPVLIRHLAIDHGLTTPFASAEEWAAVHRRAHGERVRRRADPPDLEWPEFDPAVHCRACLGCRYLATDDDRSSWLSWSSLPPGADLAVQTGLIRAIPCDACHGTGRLDAAVTSGPDPAVSPERLVGDRRGWDEARRWYDEPAAEPSTVPPMPDVVAPELLDQLADGPLTAAVEEDEVVIYRPDGSVGIRRPLTETERAVLGSPLGSVSVAAPSPDEEMWASQVVEMARAAGAEMVQFGADEPIRLSYEEAQLVCSARHPRSGASCDRPDGHRPPHASLDRDSQAAGSPVAQWRSVTE